MSDSDYEDDDLHEILYNDIRSSLNIDHETVDDAWNSYRRIGDHYVLQGKKMDWIACALYVACRKCVTQTGRGKVEGNMVSLTRILRCCDISLLRFFSKMKNWIQMSNLPIDLSKKIDQIEKNFNVTSVIFKKYRPIFEDVFKYPSPPCRFSPKNRKIRKQPLNSMDVFTFCWTMFVFVKSRFSKIGHDLVNSYHLLLVCIDYCFSSILSFDNYKDIINTAFYDKLTKEKKSDLRSLNNVNRVSIIDALCSKWNGIPLEVHHIRISWFKSLLDRLIKNNSLRKRANGIIDNDSIDFNYKYIKKEYEEFVLNIGDFDECIFLNESASDELGTSDFHSLSDIDEKLLQRQQEAISCEHNSSKNLVPVTPLSSKQYLASRTPVKKVLTPISSATTSISRLHSILMNHSNEPSRDLDKIFEKCDDNPKIKIMETIKKMGDIFAAAYAKANPDQSVIRYTEEYRCVLTSGDEFASKRRELAEKFFYYILEKLLKSELSRRIPENLSAQSLSRMVASNTMIRSLFACSLEIILFSYNLCNRVFPWVLEIYDDHPQLKISPFFFYKVIELIIREEQSLSRDIVKHLNTIEEKILDSMAWTHDSPLWVLLSRASPPTCAEVSLNLFNKEKRENGAPYMMSPAIKTEFNATVWTNFTPPKGQVKKRLFQENAPQNRSNHQDTASVSTRDVSVIISAESLPTNNAINSIVKEENDENNLSPPTPVKDLRNAQLNLFFRKVYSLASIRLRDLFQRLNITSDDLQEKIWTLLENALQDHTYLMCDHHLDQIIMCSIYGITRINAVEGDRNLKFSEILEAYRLQPQASNLVYRDVLLSVPKMITSEQKIIGEIEQPGPATSDNDNSTGDNIQPSKRGTIIDFYNTVYLPKLTQSFIMKFAKNSNVKLSPMPRNKFSTPNINSPLRCVPNYPVFVSPLRSSSYTSPIKPITTIRMSQNTDTSKDLEHINHMMKSGWLGNSIISNNAASRDVKASIATAMVSMAQIDPGRIKKRIFHDNDDDNDQTSSNSSSPPKRIRSLDHRVRMVVTDRNHFKSASSSPANASVSGDESNDSSQSNSLSIKNDFQMNNTCNNNLSSSISSNQSIENNNNNNNNSNFIGQYNGTSQIIPITTMATSNTAVIVDRNSSLVLNAPPTAASMPSTAFQIQSNPNVIISGNVARTNQFNLSATISQQPQQNSQIVPPAPQMGLVGTVLSANTINPISAE